MTRVEGGNYVVPNVLCPREQVSRRDNMDETVIYPPYLCILDLRNVYLFNNDLYSFFYL